jgi:hypothetical protein
MTTYLIFFNCHKNVQVGSGSGYGSVIYWPPGFGSIIQDYGSADPVEIFTDPEHWFPGLHLASNQVM